MPTQTDKAVVAAIAAVDRGWYVFPVAPNSKRPLLPWRAGSSKSHNQVNRWARQHRGCNWGVDCGKSALVVLDVDCKNGKDGAAELRKLQIDTGALPTYTVVTPNSGQHHYYSGSSPSRAAFRPGLDLKADGGYVVLAGGTLPTGNYLVADDVPILPAPSWLLDAAGRRKVDKDATRDAWITEPDKPEYIAWAINWLEGEAPESVAGKNGDDTLVKRVLFTLRDNGISEDKAVELITEHYNECKCFPPWTDEELRTKARNAYRYASLAPAAATPEARLITATTAFNQTPLPGIHAVSVADIESANLPPRRWIVYHRLLRGYATGLIAPGGVGKSTFTFLDALAVATGHDLTGDRIVEPGPVVLYNAEDPLVELQMRFAAVAQHNGVNLKKLPQPVYLVSGRDHKLSVAAFNQRTQSYTANDGDIAALTELLQSTGAILFVGDPFIRLHDVPENDNVAIDKVTEIFTDLADKLQIGVHLVHHTRKLGAAGGEGDQETARGASSFIAALRLAHTLSVMSEADAKKYAVSPDQRKWYVRLDDAKLNLAPPADKVRWYKRVSVPLENGENIGTLEMVKLEAKSRISSGENDLVNAVAHCRPGADVPLTEIVAAIIEEHPEETRTATAMMSSIRRRLVGNAVQVGNLELSMLQLGSGKPVLLRIVPLSRGIVAAAEAEMLG